jgi:hypothetical protein
LRVMFRGKARRFLLKARSPLTTPAATPHLKKPRPAQSPDGTVAEGFGGAPLSSLFPPGLFDGGRPGRGGMAAGWEALGSKMGLVVGLLGELRAATDDKVVIVSNYTQVGFLGLGDGWGDWECGLVCGGARVLLSSQLPSIRCMKTGCIPSPTQPNPIQIKPTQIKDAGSVWPAVPRAGLGLAAAGRVDQHRQEAEAGGAVQRAQG